MARWRDELTARIAAMTDEDWDAPMWVMVPATIATPDGTRTVDVGRPVRSKQFEVPFDTSGVIPLALMREMNGRVNDRECCGAARGTLLVRGFTTWRTDDHAGVKATMTVVLRDRSWNQFPTADGWAVLRDAKGNPPYAEADFGVLDMDSEKAETWRDRPPLF